MIRDTTDDSFSGFGMFTPEGNRAAAATVRLTEQAVDECGLTRDEMLHLLRATRAGVQQVHPEITDTEPEEFSVEMLNVYLTKRGLPVITREELHPLSAR
jgi:hypothetical protein